MKLVLLSRRSGTVLLLASLISTARPGEAISLKSRVVQQIEMGEVTWYDAHSKLGAFSFIPPAGWQLQTRSAEGCLTFHSPDLLTSIEMKFAGSDLGRGVTNRTEALRNSLAGAYPGAVIVEEFACHTSVAPGQAFDLNWKPSKQVEMAARVVLVSCLGGSIEFHLLARPEKIKESYNLFSALLTSFSRRPPDDEKQNH
jgi:hypothetical protein